MSSLTKTLLADTDMGAQPNAEPNTAVIPAAGSASSASARLPGTSGGGDAHTTRGKYQSDRSRLS